VDEKKPKDDAGELRMAELEAMIRRLASDQAAALKARAIESTVQSSKFRGNGRAKVYRCIACDGPVFCYPSGNVVPHYGLHGLRCSENYRQHPDWADERARNIAFALALVAALHLGEERGQAIAEQGFTGVDTITRDEMIKAGLWKESRQ